jgi:hypothetical protein
VLTQTQPQTQSQRDLALRSAIWLALIFAAIKLAIHIVTTRIALQSGYGIFRDELYYIMCGRNLAWGYVDHSPMVALQARIATALFPGSIDGLRFFSELAGAAKVFLTGILAWSMGGRRVAQALAMIGVIVAPQYLGIDSYLSMNSFEPVFWMTAMLAIILIIRGGSQRWWIVFGIAAGLGLENKPSIVVFLVALLIGILLTPQRRVLFNFWCLAGIAIIVLLGMPNLLWQIHYYFPTIEFLRNGAALHKVAILPPLQFIHQQIDSMHPLNVFLWGAGIVWLLSSRAFRWIAFSYLIFLAAMMALHAKDYYLAPIYPVLFAAGGMAWQSLLRWRSTAWVVPAYASILVVTGAIILPMAIPVLTPAAWVRYTEKYQLRGKPSENAKEGPLPQFYADRFGWQELADKVTAIYQALPAADRARAGILCSNYGEASAINVLAQGRGLPFATSRHNSYFMWGPHGETGDVLILVEDTTVEHLETVFEHVEVVGAMDNPLSMPYERRPIFLCRGIKVPFNEEWQKHKLYI